MKRPIPDDVRESKKMPLVVIWNDSRIYLGELTFLEDGSLIFESGFHGSKDEGATLEFGVSNLMSGKFNNSPADSTKPVGIGHHISLHPPKDHKTGVMHMREHYPGDILYRREIDWIPVIKPFNLLHLFTLPLDMCQASQRKATIITPVDSNYKDSLELVVDIFPLGTEQHNPIDKSIEVWGFCPNYLVRVSIALTSQRTAALMYWPEDNKLEL